MERGLPSWKDTSTQHPYTVSKTKPNQKQNRSNLWQGGFINTFKNKGLDSHDVHDVMSLGTSDDFV